MAILKSTSITSILTTTDRVVSEENNFKQIDLKNCTIIGNNSFYNYKYEGDLGILNLSESYSITSENIILVDCSSSNVELALDYFNDREIYIKKIDNTSNNIILKSNLGDYQTLRGSGVGFGDYFSNYGGVAMNNVGDRLFVAAEEDEKSPNGAGSGVVYVFDRIGNNWQETAIITGSFAKESSDSFGEQQISINSDGTVLAVIAKNDELTGTAGYGVFYILKYVNSQWRQEIAFTGSIPMTADYNSLCLNSAGDRLAVGIEQHNSNRGITYIYTSGSAGWYEEKILTGSLSITNDRFGGSVSLNGPGDTCFVLAENDELTGTSGVGVIYIFTSSSLGWTEESILTGSLNLYGDCPIKTNYSGSVFVTAHVDATLSGYPTGHGVAYVFRSGSNGWFEEKILTGSTLTTTDKTKHTGFGYGLNSLAISNDGDKVFIGAFGSTTLKGYVYNFISSSNGWEEQKYMTSNITGDNYGLYVTCNADASLFAIGAPSHDSPNTNAGIVYVRGDYLKNINGVFSDYTLDASHLDSFKVVNEGEILTVTKRNIT